MEQTPLLDIIQIQTKPTGLSVSSEFGPIIPETAMATEHELILTIFSAISLTTLSETAPNSDKALGDLVFLEVPDTVEDGNVVPVSFKINCSMQKNDYPKKVHVLGLENPFPEIAIYEFFPFGAEAYVSFRCRMRKSSYLMIIAEMSDGRIGIEKKYVDVMLGACS